MMTAIGVRGFFLVEDEGLLWVEGGWTTSSTSVAEVSACSKGMGLAFMGTGDTVDSLDTSWFTSPRAASSAFDVGTPPSNDLKSSPTPIPHRTTSFLSTNSNLATKSNEQMMMQKMKGACHPR